MAKKTYNWKKALKISNYDLSNRVMSLISELDHSNADRLLGNEAKFLARTLTGTWNDQGVLPEYTHFSGLEKMANDYLKTTATSFRVKEVCVHGDGISQYVLK